MNKGFCIVLCLLLNVVLLSQNKDAVEIDSLLHVAANAKHDTTRYNAFLIAGNIYQYSVPDSALYFHDKAKQIAITLKDELKHGRALMETGRDQYLLGNSEKALALYNEALQVAEKELLKAKTKSNICRSKILKGDALSYLGSFYKSQNNYPKAIEALEACLTVGRELQDTLRQVRMLGTLGMVSFNLSENEKALKSLQESARLAELINNRPNLAVLYGNMGLVYKSLGDNEKALAHHNKALKIDEEDDNTFGVTRHLGNIISIYRMQGDFAKALEVAFRALKLAEQKKNVSNEAYIFGDIAIIYTMQNQVDKAISFYLKAIKKHEQVGNSEGIATQYLNLGIAYMQQGHDARSKNITLSDKKYDLALLYYAKADSLFVVMNDKSSRANVLANSAIIYEKQGHLDQAIDCMLKALQIAEQTEDKHAEAITCGNLGSFYRLKQNYSEAEKYLLRSLKVAEEIRAVNEIKVAHEFLSAVYEKMNKPALSLKHYKSFVSYRDSLTSLENTRASVEQEMKFNFEKKNVADSIKVAADRAVTSAQLKQEKIQRYSLYGGLVLVALFAVFMFQRFRVTNIQKKIIEMQKGIVEEKHKEITDSISYAERIQRSFLASKDLLDTKLVDYFVFFKPKDIVSGDFYWAEESHSQFYLATADSTGHGVPGAIMSLLNITSLERAIENHHEPHDILSETRKTIITRLKRDGSEEGGKDGMDCSLLCFNAAKNTLKISAAHTPVWIIKNTGSGKELLEIKGDKMPVGKHDNDHKPFTPHIIELEKGDMIYTLTDGFADQFGGGEGKKFMSKRLKEELLSVSHLKPSEQRQILEETFNKWLGHHEQVDDVTVIGIRI